MASDKSFYNVAFWTPCFIKITAQVPPDASTATPTMLLFAHPLVQKDKRLQEVVDACADFLWGEAVQQQLQWLHTLRHQVDATILH